MAIEIIPEMTGFRHSESTNGLIAAMIGAAREYPPFVKNEKSFTSKYVKLETIQAVVNPILHRNGLIVLQSPHGIADNKIGMITRVCHESGQWIESTYFMRPPTMKAVSDAQSDGGGISYAKRYALIAILNLEIHGEDFDGAAKKEKPLTPDEQERKELFTQIQELLKQVDRTGHPYFSKEAKKAFREDLLKAKSSAANLTELLDSVTAAITQVDENIYG